MGNVNSDERLTLSPTRQTLSSRDRVLATSSAVRSLGILFLYIETALSFFLFTTTCAAQITDSLDTYPPRWHLATSDCQAEVIAHNNDPTGGVGDSGCETMTLANGHGTQAVLEYRIEPVRVIDELSARVFIRASKKGQRIGLRVRYPYLSDPRTRQAVSTIVFGAEYRDVGQWQKIGIGTIVAPLRLKAIALRQEYGSSANLDDAFVDAVVINCYTGVGRSQLSLDEVTVDGMVAVTSMGSLFGSTQKSGRVSTDLSGTTTSTTTDHGIAVVASSMLPMDRVTRILQHNGEPLDWVRTLGFNTVLINQPPTERILREAMLARITIIAPPPSAPDIALESLLEPLIGYYLGTSLNEAAIPPTTLTIDRIRKFPNRWQRPIMISAAESWRAYGSLGDAMVHDLPPAIRGLAADEEIASLFDRVERTGRLQPTIVGVPTDPPATLMRQLENISGAIGAPRGEDVSWHATQLQVARALQLSPRAILFRSNRSLTSGLPEDQRRSMALSYINRHLEVIGELVAGSTSNDSLVCSGSRYRCGKLEFPGGQLLIATTYAQSRGLTLAGDGDTLQISLPPSDVSKPAWRLTHFSAERLTIQSTSRGPLLEIVSPDTVETIILSSEPDMGGRLAGAVKRVASQAGQDRWQLARESLTQLQSDWQGATSSRIINGDRAAIDLLNAAETTLRDAEPTFRAGDASATIRMARRADAWQLRSRWNLHAALSPQGKLSATTSCPPLLSSGGIPIQIMWWPLMNERGWGSNRLVGGSLDDPSMIGPTGWSFGRRSENATRADAKIVKGRQVEGDGCLVADVASLSDSPLPGGYAGTSIQIRSPSVRFDAGVPIRIDVQMRTLGFGGPDQGVLVYDTVGGPELGVLVRATPAWQTVRLYRQTIDDGEVQLLLEAIGAGEMMVDDVQIRAWEPGSSQSMPMRRIADGGVEPNRQ